MNVWCLDFDGVVCDSAGETGATGWRGAAQLWPERFAGPAPADYIAAFRQVRPALETGYESILLARLLRDGVTPAQILADFRRLGPELLARLGLERQALIALFGSTRDRWIAADLPGWLGCHGFYPGVVASLHRFQDAGDALFVITTKEKRFTLSLLAAAGLPLPEAAVFGLEAGRKTEVLRRLLARPELAGASFRFVEDRLKTLEEVAAEPDLGAVRLYFAEWGYVLPEHLPQAAACPRIQRLNLAAFTAPGFGRD